MFRKLFPILAVAIGLLLIGVLVFLAVRQDRTTAGPGQASIPEEPQQSTAETIPVTTEQPTEPTETQPTEPVMLEHMAQLYEKNPDVAGWITIEGTVVDYPVMYTPQDPEKYLRRDFDGNDSRGGVPFMEDACSIDPESDNLIIYGHNMKNGTMFRTLMSYTEEEFWKEHPQIQYSTLYETRTYDILAAFYDRVYYKYEDVFKFYQFIDAEHEDAYQEAISYYKTHALYDTGITAAYGDRLLTLVTCAYHEENGRFVVVARQKT